MASFDKFLTKVFGSSNQRFLKTVQPIVAQINQLEPEIKKLSDDQLRARTAEFKERVQREVAGITDKEELKRREREVLEALADGLSHKEIAEKLSISARTVEVYKARMMDKLQCGTLADVVRLAIEARAAK